MTSMLVLYALTSVLLVLLPFILSLWRGKPDLLTPPTIFAFGYGTSYFLKGVLLELDPELFVTYADKFVNSDATQDLTWIASFLGLSMFYVGYYTSLKQQIPQRALTSRGLAISLFVSGTAVFLAFLSILVLFHVTKEKIAWSLSVDLVSSLRNNLMLAWTDYPLFYHFPVYVGLFGLLWLHSRVLKARTSSNRRHVLLEHWALFLITGFVLLAFGSRALALSFLIGVAIYVHYYLRPIAFSTQLALLTVVSLLGGYLGIIQKINEPAGITALTLEFPWSIVYRLSSSYEQFETLLYVLNSSFTDFFYGQTFLEDVFVTYVPRAVWPEKPLDFGFIRAQNVVFDDYWAVSRHTTYPVGVLGELYLNFGWFGIAVGMFALGKLLRWLQLRAYCQTSLYPVAFCFMASNFLAPHRTFGTVILQFILVIGLLEMLHVLSAVRLPGSSTTRREKAAAQGGQNGECL